MVIHLLRYDDFSAGSSQAVEEKLAALFLQHRVPCTFGVIPFVCAPESLLNAGEVKLSPLLPDKAALLKPLVQAGLAEIALHGYAHLALAPVRGHQEFSQRMPGEIQRQLIRRGKDHLENVFGVGVRLFLPPWNKLAPSTAVVLQEEGLLLSSGGPEIAAAGEFRLDQLPCPTGISETGRALATARRHGRGQNFVGTVIHDYDFEESNLGAAAFTLAEFETQLGQWQQPGGVEQRLISDTILAHHQSVGEMALANFNLRKTVNGSRLRRKIASPWLDVYWNPQTAHRLARFFKFVP